MFIAVLPFILVSSPRPSMAFSPGLSPRLVIRGTTPSIRVALSSMPSPEEKYSDDVVSGSVKKTQFLFLVTQFALVPIAALISLALNTEGYGLGANFSIDPSSVKMGLLSCLPLFAVVGILEVLEPRFPALARVSAATQQAVLSLLGPYPRWGNAIIASILVGCAAGLGEEMLFRGVLQSAAVQKLGSTGGIVVASLLFGAVHLSTALYAVIACIAGLYFGSLYAWTGNLAIPLICHGVYDALALLWAHRAIVRMTESQRGDVWLGVVDDDDDENGTIKGGSSMV